MANDDDKPEDGNRSGGPARTKPKTSERPFDMWLQKQLHAMYDEIASEPLPEDLLNLIDTDAAKEGAKRSGPRNDKPDLPRRK